MGDVTPLLQLGGLLPIPPPSGSELACGRAARWKSEPLPPLHLRTDISIFPPCLQLTSFLDKLTWKQPIYSFVSGMWPGLRSSAPQLPQLGCFIPKRVAPSSCPSPPTPPPLLLL